MRSTGILEGADFSINRSVFYSMGYSKDCLSRPIIGIANAWSTLVPGHQNLKMLADYVKCGIYRAGGTAVEFGVIGVCDGTAQGHNGMHFAMPTRELIASDIESMAQAHQLDGLVLMGSCDKIVPGMLMAAARLDIPCILLPGGPMTGGKVFDGRRSDLTSPSEAVGMLSVGKINADEMENLERTCCSSCGSCSFYGTANTMCVVAEALGMSLPGAALIPTAYPERIRCALASGEAIVHLVERNVTARKIFTEKAIDNAIRVCLATSGSTNAVMHLAAIAYEAELKMNVVEHFERLNETTPVIVKVNPASSYDMEDFYRAGGVPLVMKKLSPKLNTDVMTVTGDTLSKNLDKAVCLYDEGKDVIRDIANAFSDRGGLTILHGNLAERSAVSKPGAIDPSVRRFVGTARTFDCEEDAEHAILAGEIEPGTVIVIRYEGPKGGPGMREMYKAMKFLNGMGLAKTTAVVTDGRFSGTNNGCFVGHISPEAAEGGNIALVEDGDIIDIDTVNGELNLNVSDDTLAERRMRWKPREKKFKRGYLAIYSQLVSSADEGAIIKYEG